MNDLLTSGEPYLMSLGKTKGDSDAIPRPPSLNFTRNPVVLCLPFESEYQILQWSPLRISLMEFPYCKALRMPECPRDGSRLVDRGEAAANPLDSNRYDFQECSGRRGIWIFRHVIEQIFLITPHDLPLRSPPCRGV